MEKKLLGAKLAHSPLTLAGAICLVISMIVRNCCRYLNNGEYFEVSTTTFQIIFGATLIVLLIETIKRNRNIKTSATQEIASEQLKRLAKEVLVLFLGWLAITAIARFISPEVNYYVSIYVGLAVIVLIVCAIIKFFRMLIIK